MIITSSCFFRCVLVAPNYLCLKSDSVILFSINIFKPKQQPEALTINHIMGSGSQGPYSISLVPGNIAAISISADNNRRKRLMYVHENENLTLHSRDIEGNNFLYVNKFDDKTVVLESSYNNEVSIAFASSFNRITKI